MSQPHDRPVGDATMKRIDDLAGGWSVPAGEGVDGAGKQKSRRAARGSAPGVRSTSSGPPPPPPGRKRRGSGPPPPPPGRKKTAAASAAASGSGALPIALPLPPPPRAGATPLPGDAPDTARSDATDAPTEEKSRKLRLAPVSGVIESRDASGRPAPAQEPTLLDQPGGAGAEADAEAVRRIGSATGSVRLSATLPHRGGPAGDILYALGVGFRLAAARRELAAVGRKLSSEKDARDRRLADLAREALADPDLDSETVRAGRERLLEIEDRRSRHAGGVVAADEDIAAIERARDQERAGRLREIAGLRDEVRKHDETLEPLRRRRRGLRRQAGRVHEHLADLDHSIARRERRLRAEGKAAMSASDLSDIEADIAARRAERATVAQEEPVLAAQLEHIELQMSTLTAARNGAAEQAVALERAESEASVRAVEKIAAARARRVVDDRAVADQQRAQEDELRALGERINVVRPAELRFRLAPIEQHEVAIATLERRSYELGELVRSLDRGSVVRGALWLALCAAVLAAPVIVYLWA